MADINNKQRAEQRTSQRRERAERTQGQGKGNVRTVWGANDITHAANMMDIDIDAIGFRALRGIRRRPREQRERKRFCISDRRRRKAKSKMIVQKEGARGPRWDSNPRGYEQEIGPNHLRKGRHEPSSCAYDRGHKGYKHWDRIWDMGNGQWSPKMGLEPTRV